jgi:hypothetical protein
MKKLVLLLAVVALGIGGWRLTHHASAEAPKDATLAFDRLWIDHLPKDERDTVNVYLARTEQPVGIFQAASMWRGQYEIFHYEANGDEVRAVFPQSGDRERFKISAAACDKNGFQYCLELKGASHGVKRYYSMKGWEIDGGDADRAEAQIAATLHALVAHTGE